MRSSSSFFLFLPSVAAACVALGACAASPTSPMENEMQAATNYQPQDHDEASDSIAVARCHREDTCGHVGQGRAFETRHACEWALREPTRAQVPTCTEFDGIVLDQCLTDIRALRCGSDLSTVENMESCRARRLCKR